MLVLASVGTASYLSLGHLMKIMDERQASFERQLAAEHLLSSVKDAETGQRGYIITDNDSYLEPYETGQEEARRGFDALIKLSKSDSKRAISVQRLQNLVASKFEELRRVVELRRNSDFAAAQGAVGTDKGKNKMDEIRAVVDEMQKAEIATRESFMTEASQNVRHAVAILAGGNLLALVVMLLGGWLLSQNIGRPLAEMTAVSRRIAAGELTSSIQGNHRSDEVGVLRTAFSHMNVKLAQISEAARRIAEGDLSVDFQPESDKDEVGTSFARMLENLREVLSQRAQDEERLRDAAERMKGVLHTAVEGIITIDEKGGIETVNPAAERLFGYASEEMVGQNVNMLMPEPYHHEHDGYLANYARTGHAKIIGIGREVSGKRKDGSVFAMELSVGEVRTAKRRFFTGIVRDVSERKRIERETLDAVNVLTSAATEINASVAQVAASAAETATAVTQTTATVEEVKQAAELNNEKVRKVSDSAQNAAQTTEHGKSAVASTIDGMNRIRAQTEVIGSSMLRLSEQTQTVGEIIATVNDLAEQSNILAVNASIEAAKAGEHGKGFGVVAQEVRSLAEQSKQATNQVRSILSEIQKATAAAMLSIEQGSKAVHSGLEQSEQAGRSISKLSENISDSAQAAVQVAVSSQQQVVGMDQIATAIRNIQEASMQNAAAVKQVQESSRSLSELGRKLKSLVVQNQS